MEQVISESAALFLARVQENRDRRGRLAAGLEALPPESGFITPDRPEDWAGLVQGVLANIAQGAGEYLSCSRDLPRLSPVDGVTGVELPEALQRDLYAQQHSRDPRFFTGKQIQEQGLLLLPGGAFEENACFHAYDVSGLPPLVRGALTDDPNLEPLGPPPTWSVNPVAEEAMKKVGADLPIRELGSDPGASGGYHRTSPFQSADFFTQRHDCIALEPRGAFSTAENFYATTFHEISHAAGGYDRLQFEDQGSGPCTYNREEMRAELAGFMLLRAAGVSGDPVNTAAYVDYYHKKLGGAPQELEWAVRDATIIASYWGERFQGLNNEQAIEKIGRDAYSIVLDSQNLPPDVTLSAEEVTAVRERVIDSRINRDQRRGRGPKLPESDTGIMAQVATAYPGHAVVAAEEGQTCVGRIVEKNPTHVLQAVGRNKIVVHPRECFTLGGHGVVPDKGAFVQVLHSHGLATATQPLQVKMQAFLQAR